MKFSIKRWPAAVLGLMLFSPALRAAEPAAPETPPQEFPQGILFPYYLLDRALEGRVDKAGRVNYVAMQNDKWLALFMQAVATTDLTKFPVMQLTVTTKDKLGQETEKIVDSRSPELVFWINSYNAHVLKAILAAYPISKITDIKDFDTSKNRRVAGKDYSLAEMRKKVIELEPLAFFALCDGSESSPYLKPDAYRLVDLNELLLQRAQFYVTNPEVVKLSQLDKKVVLSSALQELDSIFAPKNPRRKWEGVRQLLIGYTTHTASRNFYINNAEIAIVFEKPSPVLNRDKNQSPVGGS